MKAHEARSIARRSQPILMEGYSDVPESLLTDEEVLAARLQVDRCIVAVLPAGRVHLIDFSYADGPQDESKRRALRKLLHEDGYVLMGQEWEPDTLTIAWWGVDSVFEDSYAQKEEVTPDRPRVSPESKVTLTTHNPFATAEVEKRIFAANVSEDGKVLSVDPVETSHNLTVE